MKSITTSTKYFALAFLCLVICFFKCSLGGANGAGVRVYMDTTKPKVDNHRFILRGSDTMFVLLQTVIYSPMDVTPNQLNAVKNWFQQNIKIDSTIKK